MKKEKYMITGMSCSACSSRVEKVTSQLPGMVKASVNLLTGTMQTTYDEHKLNSADIIKAVVKAGYGANLADGASKASPTAAPSAEVLAAQEIKTLKTRLELSVLFLIPLLYIAMHKMLAMAGIPTPAFIKFFFDGPENALTFAFTQFLLVLPIIFINKHFYKAGLKNLWHLAPNMDTLVAVGSGSALLYGIFAIFRIGFGLGHQDLALVQSYQTNLYFESAGMIVTLITMGRFLESRAKGKTSAAITKLMNLVPKEATVLRDNQEVTISASDLVAGDVILVRPGENFPADGVILEGTTTVDEASITGESLPVDKQTGSTVISATINKTGFVKFRATKVGADSTISQIIKFVDEASSSKAPIARLADKIAGIFVPAVISIAIIVTIIWLLAGATFEFAFSIGISILVISCPCALGLATPVAIMVGTGWGAQHGILIKSGEVLETAHSVDTIVLDKTGTVTEGKPKVTALVPVNTSAENLLHLATGLEYGSEHPVSKAILAYATEQHIPFSTATDFHATFGKGVQGNIEGQIYYAGNEVMMQEIGINTAVVADKLIELADAGSTPLFFSSQNELLGIIAVADAPKPDSLEALNRLKAMGLDIILLTGDNKRTAAAIGRQLGLAHVQAEVLPEGKAQVIAALQKAGHKVAMIGDGINDAPALTQADVGMAIGSGTDIAIESADAILMRNNLLDVVSALKLSKAVLKNIKENLFWAFFYNIICIPVAAGVLYPFFGIKLSPIMGAAAMSMSSVCVVFNALRLRFLKADVSKNNVSPAEQNKTVPQNVTANNAKKDEVLQMEKTLKVEGMMCEHCQKHVTDALKALPGVTAVEVSLAAKTAKVTAQRDIPESEFAKAITDAGYELVK
jgi:Cu+-exporting ATPase